jgi:isopenicillin N synthase-like dioxygenase
VFWGGLTTFSLQTYGSFEHTDYGMFTLLSPDPIGGLEVKTRSGEWVAAPYIENTLLVNIGDMFSRWTNDIFQSTPHRVLGKHRADRYSVAMFYHLNADATVRCLPSCVPEGAAPKYEPIPYLEHLVFKFNQNLKAKF